MASRDINKSEEKKKIPQPLDLWAGSCMMKWRRQNLQYETL